MKTNPQIIAETISALFPIPIPLLEIAKNEGISVIYDDYGYNTFDGMTWYEPSNDKFFIHINTRSGNTCNNTKGRFTLAHELGHYFIDRHRHALEDGSMQPHIHRYDPFGKNEEWMIEREADDFAAHLLMPTNPLKAEFKGIPFSGNLIKSIAVKYQVSFSACAIRYLRLNQRPLMLVFAQRGKIKWQMQSPDFPFYRLKYGKNKIPENTVMGDYFLKNDSSYCCQDELVYAGDCFVTFDKGQNRNEFFEYCIPYKESAFSMIWEK